MVYVTILALIGIILSVYLFHVQEKVGNKEYSPICDINDRMSCSKIVSSKYSRLLGGLSNSFFGIVFYFLVIVLFYVNAALVFYLALIGVFVSFYLGYVQYFKIKGFCVVCTTLYVVNLFLLLFSII